MVMQKQNYHKIYDNAKMKLLQKYNAKTHFLQILW